MHAFWIALGIGVLLGSVATADTPADVAAALHDHLAPHPRLLLTADGLTALQDRIAHDPRTAELHRRLLAEARDVLKMKPLERKLQGKRLLAVSRDALHRVPTLALAYRTTGDKAFLDGAIATMRTAAAFDDFNPSHFLDTAEMTAALAIGYDWLYADLTPTDRDAVRDAIVNKGLFALPTNPLPDWFTGSSNWTQVCNGGLTLGALAIAEHGPADAKNDALVRRTIGYALKYVPVPMAEYAPDGAYPEGPMYWAYGTNYNAMLIAGLRTALGTDFGLSQQPGFLASADYHLHTTGPTGYNVNYSDCVDTVARGCTAAAWYLASLRHDPSLKFFEVRALDRLLKSPKIDASHDGPDWLLLAWAGDLSNPPAPKATHYAAAGRTPVATHRSGWDDRATFVAVHGGSPSNGHAHMDIGAFTMDAGGVRWADDLGMQDYLSLESKGVDLWKPTADSGRWRVFRIGPMSHNILTVDGLDQTFAGRATITKSADAFTVLDTTPVYAGQFTAATRGVLLRPDESVRVQDEVVAAPRPPSTQPSTRPTRWPTSHPADRVVRWAMLTHADVAVAGPAATLTQDGRTLTLRVVSPANAVLRVTPATGPAAYDAPNPGAALVWFEVALPPDASATLAVDLVPGDATHDPRAEPASVVPLARW